MLSLGLWVGGLSPGLKCSVYGSRARISSNPGAGVYSPKNCNNGNDSD